MTALTGDTFPLFRNIGKGSFQDATYASQVGPQTIRWSGWGNGLFDFNNDGYKDLFTANSHVNDKIDLFEATQYKQANRIFANLGNGKFRDVSREAGTGFDIARAHRGSALADFDGDGKIDIVVSSLGEAAELWENMSPGANHWIVLKLVGERSNRDGIGARIRIGNQWNHMTTAVSYASSSDFGVHFGLGSTKNIDKIEIRWPSGIVQVLKDVKADQDWKSTNRKRSDSWRRDLQLFLELLFLVAIGLLQRLIFFESFLCKVGLPDRLISPGQLITKTAVLIDRQRGLQVRDGRRGLPRKHVRTPQRMMRG